MSYTAKRNQLLMYIIRIYGLDKLTERTVTRNGVLFFRKYNNHVLPKKYKNILGLVIKKDGQKRSLTVYGVT